MFRMLRAEFYKMYKSRGFKVLCIVAILLGLLNVVMNNVINEEFLSKSLGTQVSEEQMESLINNDSDEIISPGSLGFHTNGAKDPFNITAVEAFHASFGSGIMEILIAVLVGTMASFLYGVYDWFDKIYELSLFYNSALVTAIKASLQDVIRSMVIGVVTMAIALGTGITIFRSQDIK